MVLPDQLPERQDCQVTVYLKPQEWEALVNLSNRRRIQRLPWSLSGLIREALGKHVPDWPK